MNLLAFDTSTEWMSLALCRGLGPDAPRFEHTAQGGALASTHLIPQAQALMDQAGLRFDELDAVVFGAGPGSFTGLRTACSVAQGLGFGAGVPVLPVDTLLAVAEDARWQLGQPSQLQVTALLDARMNELYAASYQFESNKWSQRVGYSLISPEDFCWNGHDSLAGNALAAYGTCLCVTGAPWVNALPTAAAMLRLAPQLLAAGLGVPADQALPTYIRDKVAQTTQERAMAKANLLT